MQTKNAETQMNRITLITRNLSTKFICLQTLPLCQKFIEVETQDFASLQVFPEKTDAEKNKKNPRNPSIRFIRDADKCTQIKKAVTRFA